MRGFVPVISFTDRRPGLPNEYKPKRSRVKAGTPAGKPAVDQAVPLLKALKPSPSRAAEISVYFDTDKHKLRKNGLMLRVRRIGHRHVQTIKASSSSGPFERGEWENAIAGNEPVTSSARAQADF